MIEAHGLGGRSDLPVAPWLATYAGAAVLLISFFALGALWVTPRLRGAQGGLRIPALTRVVDARTTRVVLQVVGVALFSVFITAAVLGPNDYGRANPAPTWFYVWFWVGLVPASLLLGPVWRSLNPLRTFSSILRVLTRLQPKRLPDGVGLWPAAAGIAAFVWFELVSDEAASPHAVARFVLVYAAVQVAAGLAWGEEWFSRGDAFEVYSTMIARVSPLGRRSDGAIVVRNPLDGLAATPTEPDLTPVVVLVLGSTVFDGISRQDFWSELVTGTSRVDYLALGTAGLLGAVCLVGSTYVLSAAVTRTRTEDGNDPRAALAHSLIPIAIGYTVAHYFSFAVFQGQVGLLLATDPYVRGWDLLGLRGVEVDFGVVSTPAIAVVQVVAIVVGHVVAVVAAHDCSLRLLRPGERVRGQYPLLAVMVLYTTGGIVLLAGG